MKLHIPFRPAYVALFVLLAFLCYQAHQWMRHFTGALLCGGFGTVTFTGAATRPNCSFPTLVTLSGPILTYGLEYLGLVLLRSRRSRLFGYTLIFASFGYIRYIQTLTGRGDELILAQQWFGITSQPLVALFVFLIGLPPAAAAYRVIQNPRRNLIFAASYLLPIFVLFLQLFGDQYIFRTTSLGMSAGALLGIWLPVLVVDLIAATMMLVFGSRFFRNESAVRQEQSP